MVGSKHGIRAALVLILLAGAYGLFQARYFVQGPLLTIQSPQPGSTLTDTLMHIRGTASHVSQVSLNGRPIFISEEGTFDESLLVPQGYGMFVVEAEDRFGRHVRREIELFGAPPEAGTPENQKHISRSDINSK